MAQTDSDELLSSMTGFAAVSGDVESARWDWEIRSVNGKGLDLRLRLPDGCDALEKPLRDVAGKHLARGNVTVSLRLTERQSGGATELSPSGLEMALAALKKIEQQANATDVTLTTMTAAEIAAMPGVMISTPRERGNIPKEVLEQIPELLSTFSHMRRVEGASLGRLLRAQLDTMRNLVSDALETAEARNARQGDVLKEKIAILMEQTVAADEARLNQELAILSVKADVTEEIDRLNAHIDAAFGLLDKGGPVGRKLDFLMQEFNREANTLCSKSGSSDLTTIGLDMKVLIDQMREQVQNLE